MSSSLLCLLLGSFLASAWGYAEFQNRIPNGKNVPHPCLPNTVWQGVGHKNMNGGGDRNDFGLAFQAAGFAWTNALCTQDTDQDGMTNGQELGDPNCTWVPNTTPSRTVNITHPGICDPYNSLFCAPKTTFVSCAKNEFDTCDVLRSPSTMNRTLRFTQIRVPNSETNYLCMTFDLPLDQDYHIVADQPIIDNVNVVHHMLLFGCNNRSDADNPVPTSCGMSADGKCNAIIGGWTVGQTGSCYGDRVGFRIGATGYQRVRLQIHYNNPSLVQDYTDSSGLRIFFKPVQPGDQDLMMLMTGQILLVLPPHQSRIEKFGGIDSNCTKRFITRPVNVTSVINHMHYLGISANVEVFRDGQMIKTLAYDEHYSYDSPVSHRLQPEFELRPGDEIRTTCVYSTLTKDKYTYWGEATSDEMCFAFITMHPRENVLMDSVYAIGATSYCDMRMGVPIEGCDWVKFRNLSNPDTAKIVYDVTRNCNLNGFCRPECKTVLDNLRSHPCMNGDGTLWVTKLFSNDLEHLNFLALLRSCPASADTCENHCPDCYDFGSDARVVTQSLVVIAFMAACVLLI